MSWTKPPVSEGRPGAHRVKQLPLLLSALVVLGIGLLFSSIVRQSYEDVATARAERRDLEREKTRLKTHVSEMRSMLSALNNNPAAVKSLARKELGWIAPGEKVIIIATPTPIPSPKLLTGDASPPILTLP